MEINIDPTRELPESKGGGERKSDKKAMPFCRGNNEGNFDCM
jgi:hypothetical protein